MALVIELWVGGKLIGGSEVWWEPANEWLIEQGRVGDEYPTASKIDPYGDLVVEGCQLGMLRQELLKMIDASPVSVASLASEISNLCGVVRSGTEVQLRFRGD